MSRTSGPFVRGGPCDHRRGTSSPVGRRRSNRTLFSIAVVMALVLAACSAGSEGSNNGGGGGTTTRGVTDTEIKIGGLAALTSPQGGYTGVDVGAKARFERANREGGVNGRQINYIGVKDDGEDPTRNLSQGRELVQQDGVFAIAPVVTQGLLPQTTDIFEQEKVPFVGWGFMPGFCGSQYGFGFNGCITPPSGDLANTSTAATLVDALKLGDGDTVALQGYDAEGGRLGVDALKAAFTNAGLEVVYTDTSMPTTDATDFTPFVQKIMTSANGQPPTAVAMVTLFNNTVGLTGSLNAAGYKGATMNYLTYVPGLLENQQTVASAIDGTYVNTQWLPQEFGGPAIQQVQDDLKAIGEDPTIGFATSIGYWSADVLVQMLDAAGKDLTAESFAEAVNGGWTYEPLGDPMGIGPVQYPRDHDQPTPCAALVQVKGTNYEPVLPLSCYDVIKVGG